MKIRDVKTYRLEAALAEPFAYSQAWYERRGAMLVEIIGEDGSTDGSERARSRRQAMLYQDLHR